MFDMRKCEELANLINTKHPEWKTFTVRGLKEISGYSHDTSRLALGLVNPEREQSNVKKLPKQSKKNGKKALPEKTSKDSLEKPLDDFTTLNSESLEILLVNALKKQPNNANLIGKAIDFFLKVKGNSDTIKDDIDMDTLLEIGLLIKEEGTNPEEYADQELQEPYPLELE